MYKLKLKIPELIFNDSTHEFQSGINLDLDSLLRCCNSPWGFCGEGQSEKGGEKRNKQTLPEAKLITFLSPKRHPLGT